ncbi:DUF4296 domain-containing protein [Winogradskyella sp. KYW1333]|uniref:DUF4296 domain-containing protein n=1 Tax=Winogradskyella sp. KYW1333 TaxID=2282123 RepID=UPI000DF1704E|nr:DUF4296 domain-containing protein [Winogradskyella sp. KYW1333]RCT53857.1 DUF4296 domain-containing protein [Winogradskyella sp. KYW1333]
MLKKIVVLILTMVTFLSCDNKDRPPKPSNLIPKEKMADIIYDLYIINAAKGVNRKVLEKRNLVPQNYVLTKFEIDSIQFAQSNNYYAFDTEDYALIVESVKSRLEREKKEIEDLQKQEQVEAKRKRDSLKALNTEKKEQKKVSKDSTTIK